MLLAGILIACGARLREAHRLKWFRDMLRRRLNQSGVRYFTGR